MWTAKDRLSPTPEHFDEHYLNAEGAHVTLTPDVQTRLDEVLEIVGDVTDKSILDLGGGALLGRATGNAAKYTLVDMSKEACRIARIVAPWTNAWCFDVLEFLHDNSKVDLFIRKDPMSNFFWKYDVTVAIGLVEYLPPAGMDDLFRLCPSPALAFTTAVKEAYLRYPARITVPDREDVARVADRYGWVVTKDLPRPDHVWSRFERK